MLALAAPLALVLALAMSAAGAASAQTVVAAPASTETADLQCLGVFMFLAGQPPEPGQAPNAQAWFNGGVKYYLGRLEARSPHTDWLDRLTTYFLSDFRAEFEAQKDRCGNAVIAQDEALQTWGVAFQARVEAAQKQAR